jgi:hypothetical protein
MSGKQPPGILIKGPSWEARERIDNLSLVP